MRHVPKLWKRVCRGALWISHKHTSTHAHTHIHTYTCTHGWGFCVLDVDVLVHVWHVKEVCPTICIYMCYTWRGCFPQNVLICVHVNEVCPTICIYMCDTWIGHVPHHVLICVARDWRMSHSMKLLISGSSWMSHNTHTHTHTHTYTSTHSFANTNLGSICLTCRNHMWDISVTYVCDIFTCCTHLSYPTQERRMCQNIKPMTLGSSWIFQKNSRNTISRNTQTLIHTHTYTLTHAHWWVFHMRDLPHSYMWHMNEACSTIWNWWY